MASTIELKVNINEAQALAQLNNIQVKAEQLANKKFTINIDAKSTASGFDNISNSASKTATAVGAVSEEFGTLTKQARTYTGEAQELARVQNTYQKEGQKTVQTLNAEGEALRTVQTDTYKTENATKQATKSFGSYSSEVKKATAFTDLMGDSFGRIVAKMAMWQVMGNVIATAIGAFRNALATMKEVDSELTNIQKVTDMSDLEIERLGETAYATASKYGVAANDFLESVSSFAKAGYDNAEQLSEIATKTQLVGDTTAETANKFLIATDAAYKYHGSTEQLTRVLDAANSVENNYATSIDKIAVGMPIVASTAANANVSVEELIATLGTITSVTQETGTKAATAFRALIMNIEGEIGTFLTEEGETIEVTQDGINSISDALQRYGSESIKAAKASGQIIDPLEAIGALAKAYEDGLLNDIELQNIMMNVGGKLRTNQLTALVKNFDMYESMLETIRASTGSADKEIDIMLGSWKSKLNILQNTWTQFVSHLVETDAIKGGIDILTSAVELLDSGFAKAAVTIAALTAAVMLFGKVAEAAAASRLAFSLYAIATGATTASAAISALWASLSANPMFWVAVAAAGIYGVVKAYDAVNVTLDEQREKVANLKAEYDALYGDSGEYDSLVAKIGTLTEAEKLRLAELKAQKEELAEQLRLEQQILWAKFQESNGAKVTGYKENDLLGYAEAEYDYSTAGAQKLQELKSAYYEVAIAQRVFHQNGEADGKAYQQTMTDFINKNRDYVSQLKEFQKANEDAGETIFDLNQNQLDAIDLYDRVLDWYSDYNESTGEFTEAVEEQKKGFNELADAINAASSALDNLKSKYGDEKGTEFGEQRDVYNDFLADWQGGKRGSNAVRMAIDFFIPEEVKQRLGNDIDAMGEYLASGRNGIDFSKIFATDDFGANFANQLADLADSTGALFNDAGKKIAQFSEDADGNLSMTYSSLQDLSDYSGLALNAISALIDGLDIYGTDAALGWEETQQLANDLKELEGINADSTLEEVATAISNLTGETDPSKIRDYIEALQALSDVSFDWDFTNTLSSLEEVISQSVAAAAAEHPLSEDKSATVTLEGVDAVIAGANDAAAAIAAIPASKTITISFAMGAIPALPFAEGTEDAPEGMALVNEKGAELISQDGQAFIAGGGEPTFVNLKKGAVVLTHEETQKALHNNKPSVVFPAALNGIPRSGGGSSGGGGIASAISASSGSKTSGANLEKKSDELDEKLKLIDAQIKLAENQGDLERVLQLQEEAQNLIIALINDYLASGKTLDDKEVVDLLNEGYDYWNDSQDLGSDFWKDFVDSIKDAKSALDEANELEEKRQAIADAQEALANAQNQRTVRVYNRETGQWEWIADEKDIQKAQENLEKAQKSYQDALFDAELERLENAQGANLSDVLLGSAIADVIGASTEEIQNIIASALQMVSGTASYMGSNATNAGTFPTDSHDTIYTFGDITLTQEQAETTTVADLAGMLRALSLTT